MPAPLFETLEDILFLQDISPMYLEQLALVAEVQEIGPHEVIFREGEAAEHVYLIASGKVSLEICAPSIGCRRILTLGPGELLGLSPLLESSWYTATARSTEKLRLVVLHAPQLVLLFQKHPDFGYEFMRRAMSALAKRLSATRIQLLNVFGAELPPSAHSYEDSHGR